MPPRISTSEVSQTISPRNPHLQRRSSSEFEPIHHRPITDRSPRLSTDRRFPRGSQSYPLNQKKLGTRISDLETQLIQAHLDLNNIKKQLASAEAVKEDPDELHKKAKKFPSTKKRVERRREHTSPTTGIQETSYTSKKQCPIEEVPEENHKEINVFEVPMEKVFVRPLSELEESHRDDDEGTPKPEVLSNIVPSLSELEKPYFNLPDFKNNELEQLIAELEARGKEWESACQENEMLKKQLHEAASEISAMHSKEEEMELKCTRLEKDLEASNATKFELRKKLEAVELVKEGLEGEMKKLRIQTKQWRKAADAAAAVLAGGMEMGGGQISERCGSMDKHFNSLFEPPPIGGYPGYLGLPGEEDGPNDDGFGSGKRKGSGIRMLGELWKKKGYK